MLRGRRVAGILAFALALALGLMLMFQATDPAAAAPPPQTPDDADQLSHDTEEILIEPEASGVNDGLEMSHFNGLKLNHLVFAQRFGQCA